MERVKEAEKPYRNGDWGIKYLFRGPRIDWGIVFLKPGQNMGAHYHREVEETFFILEGEGIMRVNDEELRVSAGDAIRLEPEERHDLRATESSFLKGIFIKVPYLPEDKINC